MKSDQDFQLQKNFGLRVKELRDSKGMTQEDLAEAADLFRTYISRIETGFANPSLTVIHALASAMVEPVGSLMSAPTQLGVPSKTFTRNPISRGRVSR